jgi:Na+/proline symporter
MDNRGLRLNERQMLNLARIIVLGIVVISILMALFFANALVLAYATFEVIFVSLTWPVVLGPYWKRLSAKANWIAITVGLAVYIISTIGFTDTGNVGGVIESIIVKSETLPGILGMIVGLYAFPVFWGATISLILTIVCAFIFEPTKEELIAYELQRTNVNDDVEGYPEYERETEYEWQGVHMSKKLREEYLKPGADFKDLALNYYAGVENNLEKRNNGLKA